MQEIVSHFRQSSLLQAAVRLLTVLHLGLQFAVFLPHHWNLTAPDRDVWDYWRAASRLSHGISPYWPDAAYGPDRIPGQYLYSPQFAAVLSPMGRIPFGVFSNGWYVTELAAFWAYAALLASMAGKRSLWTVLTWGLVVGMCPGTYRALSIGQVDPFLWALLALALSAPRRAWLIAVLCQIKPYAIYSLIVAVVRDRRALLPSVGALVAGTGIGLAVAGVGSYLDWRSVLSGTASQGCFFSHNISLSMAILRLGLATHMWTYHGGPLPDGPRRLMMILAIAGSTLTTILCRRAETRQLCMISLIAAMLWAPICWYYYLVIVFIPIALRMGASRPEPDAPTTGDLTHASAR